MGVPGFFSWLIKRYPMVLQKAEMQENPNIDCLYLDMNGILYKCARDEKIMFKDLLVNKNFDELWAQIFSYINNIVNSVGPTKILFMGLDGPAPRAKQNQQRSRRFQSAKGYSEMTKSLQNCGFLSKEETFKNNSISPGTDFMHQLNEKLQFFIAKKYQEDQKWKNLRVVFSGSNVAGEGEHKILSFMRQYANAPDYNINTTHCIYGADADLIMLGLSTHIPYVSILREKMPPFSSKAAPAAKREYENPEFDFIYLNMVREYMDLEFQMIKEQMKNLEYDIDQIIDDFIVLCFFIGNDFLPKCYCFDIRQGKIENLLDAYKELLLTSDCYINNEGKINWKGMEYLLKMLSEFEIKLISERAEEVQDVYNKRKLYKYDDMCDDNEEEEEEKADKRNEATFEDYNKDQIQAQKNAAKILRKEKDFLSELEKTFQDDSTEGRKKYYLEKLELNLEEQEDLKTFDGLLRKYVEGLQFVLNYYYRGVPSWSWYYPFYYAPMVTDLYEYVKYHNLESEGIKITFEKGQPYVPLKQLMCILHPENHALLPPLFSKLITDLESPLRTPFDYYPSNFKIDAFGAFFDHEYIIQLPFMDQEKLDEVYDKLDFSEMSDYDKSRNQLGENIMYQYNSVKGAKTLEIENKLSFYKEKSFMVPLKTTKFSLDIEVICKVRKLQNDKKKSEKLVFPSLHAKKILDYSLKKQKGRDMTYNRMFLKLQEEVILPTVTPKEFIPVYQGYPSYQKAYIIGWMDNKQLYKIKSNISIDLLKDEGYRKENHATIFQDAKMDLKKHLEDQGIEYDGKSESQQKIVFIRRFNSYERTSNGQIIENECQYDECFSLTTALCLTQKLIKRCEVKRHMGIQEEFPLNSQVVVFDERYLGFKGIVKDYKKTQKTTKILVNFVKEPFYLSEKEYKSFQQDKTQYFTLRYMSCKLNISEKIILALLDEVVVKLDSEKPSANKLAQSLNIGLRLICRYQNTIVPEMVRLPEGSYTAQSYQKFKQFEELELSEQAANLLTEFYRKIKHTNIISLIYDCQKAKTRVKINVNDVFRVTLGEAENFDPNIEMVKIYIWLIQNSSSLPLCPLNGKVASEHQLDDYMKTQKFCLSKNIKNMQDLIDPNLIQRQCDYVQIPMYFLEHPFHHEVGDRVVNINSIAKANVPPFGAYGVVVGVVDKHVQVVFDEPFVGGTDLGGKCTWMRGGNLEFLDVFNLEQFNGVTWRQCLIQRDDSQVKYGWDRTVNSYQPNFKSKAISDSEEYSELVKKTGKKNIFQQFEEELKQEQEEFNRREEEEYKKMPEAERETKNDDGEFHQEQLIRQEFQDNQKQKDRGQFDKDGFKQVQKPGKKNATKLQYKPSSVKYQVKENKQQEEEEQQQQPQAINLDQIEAPFKQNSQSQQLDYSTPISIQEFEKQLLLSVQQQQQQKYVPQGQFQQSPQQQQFVQQQQAPVGQAIDLQEIEKQQLLQANKNQNKEKTNGSEANNNSDQPMTLEEIERQMIQKTQQKAE